MPGRRPPAIVHPALRLVRLGNVLVSFFGTLVGGWAAEGHGTGIDPALLLPLALAGVSTACVTAGGNVLNDILDRRSDAVNHPDRPLVRGDIRVGHAKGLGVALFVIAVLAVLPEIPERWPLGVILAVALAALLGYEFRFKAIGFAGNLLVAFLTGAVFLYGAASVGAVLVVVPFALMAFFATLSREVIKDMEDAEGDVDRRTLPRTHGLGFSAGVSRAAVVVAIALSPLPFLYLVPLDSIVGIMYAASVLVADGLFVASVLPLPRNLHRDQTVSKGAMTIALIAFLVTAFR
jgi:geranylgeranylglycerol-phosphate geranylgeranyltransferase